MQANTVYAEQSNIITEMADKSDCIIVGRCADYILKDRHPLRVFVYADKASRMARCREKVTKLLPICNYGVKFVRWIDIEQSIIRFTRDLAGVTNLITICV